MTRGWWGMHCWNGLSEDQQAFLISEGYLPIGYRAEGLCGNPATCCVERFDDAAPGPRFYCGPCARAYLWTLEADAWKGAEG